MPTGPNVSNALGFFKSLMNATVKLYFWMHVLWTNTALLHQAQELLVKQIFT